MPGKPSVSHTIAIALLVVWLLAVGFIVALAEGLVPKTLRQVLLVLLVAGPLLVFGEALLQAVCYGVARAVLPILTLGWFRVEGPGTTMTSSFAWYGISRTKEGKLIASAETGSIIGLLIVAAVVVATALIYAV